MPGELGDCQYRITIDGKNSNQTRVKVFRLFKMSQTSSFNKAGPVSTVWTYPAKTPRATNQKYRYPTSEVGQLDHLN
jgi:hypothetical protein